MSTILRNLWRPSNKLIVFIHKYPKNGVINTIRCKSDVVKTLNVSQFKKKDESLEVLKWFLLMMPVTSFGLGCWQIYRLQWKLELLERMHAKTNAAPVNMPMDFEELKNMEYVPLKVSGEFLHDKEFTIGPRALIEPAGKERFGSLASDPKKNQGWLVITPFRLSETGQVILVNRGWVPSALRNKEARKQSLVKGNVNLVGVVRLTETHAPFMPKNNPERSNWFNRDLEQMSSYLGCNPVWIDARGIPDPPEGWPIPNQTRVTLRNEHLSYVVTWFSLSAFTGFMWHRFFIRRLPLL